MSSDIILYLCINYLVKKNIFFSERPKVLSSSVRLLIHTEASDPRHSEQEYEEVQGLVNGNAVSKGLGA